MRRYGVRAKLLASDPLPRETMISARARARARLKRLVRFYRDPLEMITHPRY